MKLKEAHLGGITGELPQSKISKSINIFPKGKMKVSSPSNSK